MLGRLARWLRAAGHDVLWLEDSVRPAEVLHRAQRQGRILLTRTQRGPWDGTDRILVLQSADLQGQLEEVFQAFGRPDASRRLTRCTRCNERLLSVPLKEALPRLPPRTRELVTKVRSCPSCSRLYWDGTHVRAMERVLDAAERRSERSEVVPFEEHAPEREWDRFDDFLRRLFAEHDRSFEGYRRKRRSLRPRLRRRIAELDLSSLDDYLVHLRNHASELSSLHEILSITISRFFRDREEWFRLERSLDAIVSTDGALRAWSAGCACGEEPYSLSILWRIRSEAQGRSGPLSILATDLSDPCLARARRATYGRGSCHSVPPRIVSRFFHELTDGRLELDPRVRSAVELRRHDLLLDPWPEGPFDLVLCRNFVFTYLAEPLRSRVARRLAGALRNGGVLMVGSNERVAPEVDTLEHVEGCLWRRRDTAGPE